MLIAHARAGTSRHEPSSRSARRIASSRSPTSAAPTPPGHARSSTPSPHSSAPAFPRHRQQARHTAAALDSINPSHKRQVVGRCGRSTEEHARRRSPPPDAPSNVARHAGTPGRTASQRRRRPPTPPLRDRRVGGVRVRQAVARGRRDLAEGIDFCEFYATRCSARRPPRPQRSARTPILLRAARVSVVIAREFRWPSCAADHRRPRGRNTVVMKPAEQSAASPRS